jgi:hypothetical protein
MMDPSIWLNAASEEAQLLGSHVVTLDHLFLGLLSQPDGLVARTLQSLEISVNNLRRRLSPSVGSRLSQESVHFSPDVLAVCQAAKERDGRTPHPAVWLDLLLDQRDYPEVPKEQVQKALRARLVGSLSRNSKRVGIGGLLLGMSEEEVRLQLGPPLVIRGRLWHYHLLSVGFMSGVVVWIDGQHLYQDQKAVLAIGDSVELAEEVLGTRLEVHFNGNICASAHVFLGKVQMLNLGRSNRG